MSAIVEARIIFITAMFNIVLMLMILLSCRCMNTWKLTSWLNKQAWFKAYFKWHCYVWYILLVSLVVHAVFALRFFGVPF